MMKKNLIVAALALTLSIGIGTSVYATDNSTDKANNNQSTEITAPNKGKEKKNFKAVKHVKMDEVLSEKFGITKEELTAARKEGKTLNAFLTEKGVSLESFRAALIEKHNAAIDEAVSNGKITTEKGEEIKTKIKAKIENNNFDKVRPEKGNKIKGDRGSKVHQGTESESSKTES